MGHGGAHALSLSNPDPQHSQGQYREEEGDIDMTDTEIELHLANLHPDATILLYSCLNGYGGSAADNLFGFITDHAGGRRVIAASDSFTADDVEIGRLHPLDIQIYNEEQGEDYTVVSQ